MICLYVVLSLHVQSRRLVVKGRKKLFSIRSLLVIDVTTDEGLLLFCRT